MHSVCVSTCSRGLECELKCGTCHHPLQGVKHDPLKLLTHSTPRVELRGQTGVRHSVLWENWKSRFADGKIHFRFYGPHSCISSYLEKHQNPSMMTGVSVTSGDLPETSGGEGGGLA